MWQSILQETTRRHRQMDRQIDAWCNGYRLSEGTVHCTAGCGSCCTLSVNCTFPEALLLAEGLQDHQRQAIARCAAELLPAALSCTDLKEYLRSKRQQGACPLLDDNGCCSCYSLRPLSCRSLISTRENRWCATDFGSLSPEEKHSFMAGLDRRAVDFPLHYAAFPRSVGQEGENSLVLLMQRHFGFAIIGELSYLLWLEAAHGLSLSIRDGSDAMSAYLKERGLLSPFLIRLMNPES